jgi:hypothetical protein
VLLLKLTLTPLLIAAATLVARRWGPTIGGWIVGLPLTSGPVSVFLALEQGRTFTAIAARGSILGLVGVAACCVAYARTAVRFGPTISLAAGLAAYTAATIVAQRLNAGVWTTFIVVWLALAVSLLLMPRVPRETASREPEPWWDLPLRMLAATSIVWLITTVAATLGPVWSGVLSPFPVFSTVLAAFAHYMSGSAAAARLQRGVVIGIFSFAAFFLVVSLLVEHRALVVTYALATAAALAINALSLVWLSLRSPRS